MLRQLRPRHLRLRPPAAGRPPRRAIGLLASLPAVLVPPVVFGGLLVTLWAYKCAMMVVFQNKIIYMPGVPLGAKRETLSTYHHLTTTIPWRSHPRSLRTADGKLLSTVTATIPATNNNPNHTLIVYFQGNASSTPPRLPALSAVLRSLRGSSTAAYTLLIPSYRGYWTSTGRPSQRGIEADLQAIFAHVEAEAGRHGYTDVVLWGQSIGCGIALTGWAQQLRRGAGRGVGVGVRVSGLVLETPFVSVLGMLRALYPERWLPYRYLGAFLRSSWDVGDAVRAVGQGRGVRVLVVCAGGDEVVPRGEGERVVRLVQGLGEVRSVLVRGALHGECVLKEEGRGEVVRFLKGFGG